MGPWEVLRTAGGQIQNFFRDGLAGFLRIEYPLPGEEDFIRGDNVAALGGRQRSREALREVLRPAAVPRGAHSAREATLPAAGWGAALPILWLGTPFVPR